MCVCVYVFLLGVCVSVCESESFVHNNNYNLTSDYGIWSDKTLSPTPRRVFIQAAGKEHRLSTLDRRFKHRVQWQ